MLHYQKVKLSTIIDILNLSLLLSKQIPKSFLEDNYLLQSWKFISTTPKLFSMTTWFHIHKTFHDFIAKIETWLRSQIFQERLEILAKIIQI